MAIQQVSPRNVHIIPEFRDEPDVEKLVRAFIAIAKNLAEKKKAEEEAFDATESSGQSAAHPRIYSCDGEGDTVP